MALLLPFVGHDIDPIVGCIDFGGVVGSLFEKIDFAGAVGALFEKCRHAGNSVLCFGW